VRDYSLFEIIGPNMIGPSSSHTAGACKIGYVAQKLAKGKIVSAEFLLHGSFAKTYKGHGTDRALLGGILGLEPDDERIRESYLLAAESGLRFAFMEAVLGEDCHPNTVRINLRLEGGQQMTLLGSSIGGGSIRIDEIDGVALSFTGEYPTLIIPHEDRPGLVGKVTSLLGEQGVNIAFMRVYRQQKGKNAYMIIETDTTVAEEVVLQIKQVDRVTNVFSVSIT